MLQAGVGRCLRTYKQDRHEFQNQFLEMVAEALEEVRVSRTAAVEGAEAKAQSLKESAVAELKSFEAVLADFAELLEHAPPSDEQPSLRDKPSETLVDAA